MESTLIWSRSAVDDLEAIAAYLERDSPQYAAALMEDVLLRTRSLSEFPQSGRVVPEVDDPSLREVFVDQYRVIYHVQGLTLSILSIVHMSQDLVKYWHEHSKPE